MGNGTVEGVKDIRSPANPEKGSAADPCDPQRPEKRTRREPTGNRGSSRANQTCPICLIPYNTDARNQRTLKKRETGKLRGVDDENKYAYQRVAEKRANGSH